jgi:tRNA threonylcarbamoyladenosine biosynthesis protein TsaE
MFEANRKGAQVAGSRRTISTRSAEQTEEAGNTLGVGLEGSEIVLLTGTLGAGKSVFARGVAQALGVTRWRGSPTFSIVHEYASTPALIHVDLYRLAPGEVEELGLEEYASPGSVLLVEWADRALQYLESLPHTRRIHVHLEHGEGDERTMTVEENSLRPVRRVGC